ncbi:zinc ribbon domain-containing protein [Streptomyces sp. NPDC055092]
MQNLTRCPGSRNVKAKAGLNRSMLDVGFAEIRQQIEYKAPWYGAGVSTVNPAYTSETCNRCGHVDAKSRRTRDLFTCTRCGHHAHFDTGAAVNITHRARAAQETAPGDAPDGTHGAQERTEGESKHE